jgi:ketosteroid isomerase-like protein
MRASTCPLLMILFVVLSCAHEAVMAQSPDTNKATTSLENLAWQDSQNDGGDLAILYIPDAVKAFATGEVLSGVEEIKRYWEQQKGKITGYYTDTLIVAREKPLIEYEIGGFTLGDSPRKFLIVWETDDAGKRRSFEIDAAQTTTEDPSDQIDQSRKRWVALCNQHDAGKLIREVYTANTIYYNHRPVVRGHEDLTRVHSYMNNPQYSLDLTPILSIPVNDQLVFEIGQCSGSYGGKYVIIWEKSTEGSWKVLIDTNF